MDDNLIGHVYGPLAVAGSDIISDGAWTMDETTGNVYKSVSGNVGIQTQNPHGSLQFGNTGSKRKIVLYERADNDHQYSGFGRVSTGIFYQLDSTNVSHIFAAGSTPTTSDELMRITGAGKVGIGNNNPLYSLVVQNDLNTDFSPVTEIATGITDLGFKLLTYKGETANVDGSVTTQIGMAYNNGTTNRQSSIRFHRGAAVTSGGYMSFSTGSDVERMRINAVGNVGIGTTTPNGLLQFGNSNNKRKVVLFERADNSHQFMGFGRSSSSLSYQVDTTTSNHVFLAGANSGSSNELMRITGTGRVGIGSTNPLFSLVVQNALITDFSPVTEIASGIDDSNFKLLTYKGEAANVNGSIATEIGLAYYLTGTTYRQSSIRFHRGSSLSAGGYMSFTSDNDTERMRIDNTGKVGIGTSAPDAPLHVAPSTGTAPNGQRTFFSNNGGPVLTQNNNVINNISIHAEGNIWADGGGFFSTSDMRIKKIAGLSNSADDLSILNQIEITDYHYLDTVTNTPVPQKKVIAQQLKAIYPSAVGQNEGVIPNVFALAEKQTASSTTTEIVTSQAHGFSTGDQVKLILENKGELLEDVTVIDENTFTVNMPITDKIFVYGKKVDDLLNVDYDAVAMLNVSATQELSKQVDLLKAANSKLTAENESLKAESASANTTMLILESRLSDLEAKLNSILTPAVVQNNR